MLVVNGSLLEPTEEMSILTWHRGKPFSLFDSLVKESNYSIASYAIFRCNHLEFHMITSTFA